MARKNYMQVSTKIDSDISNTMKLLKSRFGSRTESDAMRAFIEMHDPDILRRAQELSEMFKQVLNGEDDA